MISHSSYKVRGAKPYNRDDQEGEDGWGDGTADYNRGPMFSRSLIYAKQRGRGGGRRDLGNNSYTPRKEKFSSKPYEDRKYDIKLILPEDVRISKLLRKLSLENNQEHSLEISKKLLEVLMLPDNALYVRKSFNILGESIYEILQVAPGPRAKNEASRCLGRMGYIMAQENDFDRFQKWMFNRKNCFNDMTYLFMTALKETFALERKKSVLKKYAAGLIEQLATHLETVDNVKIFKAMLDNLMSLAEMYPEEFCPHLSDVVDVIIGWHVDPTQALSTVQFISENLFRISKHFQSNLQFSVTMVQHFLEDIASFTERFQNKTLSAKKQQDKTKTKILNGDDFSDEEIKRFKKTLKFCDAEDEEEINDEDEYENENENDTKKEKNDDTIKVEDNSIEVTTLFILALNTILKCLGDKLAPKENKYITDKLITECLTQILSTIQTAMNFVVADNLFIASNECISLLLTALEVKQQIVANSVFKLIELELNTIHEFSEETTISMLLMTSTAIKELSAQIPIELIESLIGPSSPILKMRFSQCEDISESVVLLYQSLLNVKNIPLLQEAYKYILGDFEVIYKELSGNVSFMMQKNPFTLLSCKKSEVTYAIIFFIRAFSQLATTGGSIICMWAIQPSILELLVRALTPLNEGLYKKFPALQYSFLYLLHSHCNCYQHYISISDLVSEGCNPKGHLSVPENFNSNSGNFATILETLIQSFNTDCSGEMKLFLLKWFGEVLTLSESSIERIYLKDVFQRLSQIVLKTGYDKNSQVVLGVYNNLNILLANKQLAWDNKFLSDVCDLCILHMKSNNPQIRDAYSNLLLSVPWDVTIPLLDKGKSLEKITQKDVKIDKLNNYNLLVARHLHMKSAVVGEMQPMQFKWLMNYLLNGEERELLELFLQCWVVEGDPPIYSEDFRDLALNSSVVLNNWLTWSAAQFCINKKLRTPLGKPIETFTSFETSLKQLAKEVMKVKTPKVCEEASNGEKNQINQITLTSKRIKILLQFMEHLEMAIYNASEGCALAMPAAEKPVRTFFSMNASTCKEWLSRIRVILIQLSLHAGQSASAYRHSEALLRDLSANNKQASQEFETAVIYATISLLNLHEPEAIQGLHTWTTKLGCSFDFLKPAIEQANKHFEYAIAGYSELYKKGEKKLKNTFLQEQITACCKELNDWNKIVEIQEADPALESTTEECEGIAKINFNLMLQNNAQLLLNLENDVTAFNALNSWENEIKNFSSSNQQELKNQNQNWSCYNVLNAVESNIYQSATKAFTNEHNETNYLDLDLNLEITGKNNKYKYAKQKDGFVKIQLEETFDYLKQKLQEDLISNSSDFTQKYCFLSYINNGLKNAIFNEDNTSSFLVSGNFENEVSKIDSTVLSKVLWWCEYFFSIKKTGYNLFCNNLRLNIVKKARKESNLNLACTQLFRFLNDTEVIGCPSTMKQESLQINFIKEVGENLLHILPELQVWNLDTSKAVMEVVKILHDQPDCKALTYNLCAVASTSISKFGNMNGRLELLEISGRILLKLSHWLQNNDTVSLSELGSPLGKFLMVLPEIAVGEPAHSHFGIIPMNELSIGKLLQFSVQQCVSLGKAWNAFGTWCYRWGRKIVQSGQWNISEEDQLLIRKYLPIDVEEVDINRVYSILSQSRTAVEDEDIDSNEINTSEIILTQLQNIPILMGCHKAQLEDLVQIWIKMQKRIYSYYELSAEAYFKYLQLVSNSEGCLLNEYNTVTVTLRLLRLIVRHALELQSVLENGLATTPTQPWKVIIPQLFSRLNHPENYVRQRVSELLCRIAEDAPHLITFPAVVGALEGGVKFNFSEISLPKDCLSQNNDNNEYEDLEEDIYDSDNNEEDSKNVLRTCFKSMVETLSKQAPVTITQVQLFVKELRRIILLWDELWLGTLAQHHSEITRRQAQLELEIEKVNENQNLNREEKISLITEKHRIIIKPIIYILEQLYEITSVEPETPHEANFQERYLPFIRDVLTKLKNPQNPDKPQESWAYIKMLQQKFSQKTANGKRSIYSLKLQDISPVLYNLKDTVIAMPGLNGSLRKKVFIMQLANHVSILPTKTKPKKLIFHGSDGQIYTYLFKGLEDLHLDERIMQFLSIANTMMTQIEDGGRNSNRNMYKARHYSVIPLGPRSGLISWVDGTTPLFTLYKRWQQREATKKNASGPVLRPSDLFYNKLNPLLQKAGVKNMDNRKEWPLSVLKQVLVELMNETPKDLLAKELWCHSVDAEAWWKVVRNYVYSTAVMSVIGYIIGLGDRHLDNVLIDLTSGEVVHIDYNVCFEKGKTLRVPEKVPFRLTPNIQEALGVNGVEGMFRLSCENVLRVMKKGRETLLTLLEAFVYDPLVDWTVGGEGLAGTTFGGVTSSTRQSRKNLEKEVTISMFNVRCTELKIDWVSNREGILLEIPQVQQALKAWRDDHKKVSEIEDHLQDLHQQMALLKEAEANGISKHTLHSLPTRYEAYKKTRDILSNAKQNLTKLIMECEAHIRQYNEALVTIESPDFAQFQIEINATTNFDGLESLGIFEVVKEFLQNAGQTNMITQCEQTEREVFQLAQQQSIAASKCFTLLQEYEAVLLQCPISQLDKHRIYMYLRWANFLKENPDLPSCELVSKEFYELAKFKHNLNVKTIAKFAYALTVLYNDLRETLGKLYKDYAKLHDENPMDILDKRYVDAKCGLSNFLKKEKGALNSFEFVLVGELLILNKAFLQLETAVSRSGEWLLILKGREGDWFLDELAYYSSKAVEFVGYLALQQQNKVDDPNIRQLFSCMHNCDVIYKDLVELYANFHTIILPESMRKIQKEEPTVLHVIGELGKLIHSVGVGLPDLVTALEKYISCIVMEMDNNPTYELAIQRTAELKQRFKQLLQSLPDHNNPGKMLLVGFSCLFEKLTMQMNDLVNALAILDMPIIWRKIDQINEAKSMAAPTYSKIRALLDDIFFIKRLQTMSEFFGLCLETCKSSAGLTSNVVVLNDEQLSKPVKKFICDFISRQFLGITTEVIAYIICVTLQHLGLDVSTEVEQRDIGAENKIPLDEICHKGWGLFVKNGLFSQNVAAQASGLVSNLKIAWEKLQEPKKFMHNINLTKSSLVRVQNHLTAHNWLYEDILRQPYAQNTCTFVKSKFILEMKTESTSLSNLHLKLQELREQQKVLIGSAGQRLRWAAGANPDLNKVLTSFEAAVNNNDTHLDRQIKIANIIVTICNIILQHETLCSQTPETQQRDDLVLATFENWKEACQYSTTKLDTVTPVEENIMKLYSSEMVTNPKWISLVSDKISEHIATYQKELLDQKAKTSAVHEKIIEALENLKIQYNQHVKIMSDFKPLVKALAKIEGRAEQAQDFIILYRTYISNFSAIFHHFKGEVSEKNANELLEFLDDIERDTEGVYSGLLELEGGGSGSGGENSNVKNELGVIGNIGNKGNDRQDNGNGKGQQKNMYAVNVWRRVRMKLEGRDPDPGRKYTTQEQVDYIIREATSVENLALLYEGWTPWV